MKQKLLLLISFFTFQFIIAQEIYLNTGKNYTSYHYKNAIGESSSILNRKNRSHFNEGNQYEIGYVYHFKNSKISYIVGLSLNEFNVNYFLSNTSLSYSWSTKYIGIQNLVAYSFFENKNGFEVNINGGCNSATLLNAEEMANSVYYDISKQEDFAGVIIQPTIGLSLKYKISERASLSLGYNFSTVVNISKSTLTDLRFSNNQIKFGINIPINQN